MNTSRHMKNRVTNKEMIEQIKNIEEQLASLRLELEQRDANEHEQTKPKKKTRGNSSFGTGPLRTGESVVIINPRKGQGNEGILRKINFATGYGIVSTTNGNKCEIVVRKIINLRRK